MYRSTRMNAHDNPLLKQAVAWRSRPPEGCETLMSDRCMQAITLINSFFFFLNEPPPPEIYSLPLPAPLPIFPPHRYRVAERTPPAAATGERIRCRRSSATTHAHRA